MLFDASKHNRDFTGSLVIVSPIRHQKSTLCHQGSAGTSEIHTSLPVQAR
jgi:hypothetical protein